MKKHVIYMFLVWSAINSYACDHCNLFLNMNPNDYKNTLGFQFRTRLLSGTYDNNGYLQPKHAGHTTHEMAGKTVTEHYHRYELTGMFFIKKVWNVQFVMPLINSVQSLDGLAKYNVWGVGDPIVLANYQVFNTKNQADTIRFSHRLLAGLGIKMPFGSTSVVTPLGKPNLDLQPGSGSLDGLVSLTYIAKYKKTGVFLNSNIKVNTANSDAYKYGSTVNTSLYLFYQKTFENKCTIMPTIGIYTEIAAKDVSNAVIAHETGGQNYLGDVGINLFLKKIRFSVNFQPFIASNMRSATQIDIKNRVIGSINYNF